MQAATAVPCSAAGPMDDNLSHTSFDSAEFIVVNSEPKFAVSGDMSLLQEQLKNALDDGQMEETMVEEKQQEPEVDAQVDPGHTIFEGLTYLGSASVNAPRSENEINKNMEILNSNSQMSIPITLSVPPNSEGIVRLLDPGRSEIACYPIHRILFCVRGNPESPQACCFAFTCSHGDSADTAIFQCHVFRSESQDGVSKVLYSFGLAFRRVPHLPPAQTPLAEGEHILLFSAFLDIKEDDSRGGYASCPRDKTTFKLRRDLDKKVSISVQQVILLNQPLLKIERCFGLLLTPGRNVKSSDMQLIEMVSMGNDGQAYVISGLWYPTEGSFEVLNTETTRDTRVFMTIAVDLVVEGIQEPVRFIIETKVKIFPTNERFWYFNKRPIQEQFLVRLKETSTKGQFDMVSVDSQSSIERRKALNLMLPQYGKTSMDGLQTPGDPDEDTDTDEPLLSGSGAVSKEVTDADLLNRWSEVLTRWQQTGERPKQVTALCRLGIPEALRGEVWQLLAGCRSCPDLLEDYRTLITKESPCENVIMRDINRTFPAHEYFRESGGTGQDSLYKISKAYSIYDEEIGYCQGLSFLAAALLLHMPEEQAFCVLVRIMFDKNLRDLYKQGFELLHLNFFQLNRLVQDQLPDLADHFMELGLETHMFASQWFLTLYTAKFPLFMVFHILDIFLAEGRDMLLKVALALLKTAQSDLLALDFESMLKYFRVQLPKRYRSHDAAKQLILTAVSAKVSSRKKKKVPTATLR